MYPRQRQAVYLQSLREHVNNTTPKVRRPRSKRWGILAKIAGDLLLLSAALVIGAMLFHQLFERG